LLTRTVDELPPNIWRPNHFVPLVYILRYGDLDDDCTPIDGDIIEYALAEQNESQSIVTLANSLSNSPNVYDNNVDMDDDNTMDDESSSNEINDNTACAINSSENLKTNRPTGTLDFLKSKDVLTFMQKHEVVYTLPQQPQTSGHYIVQGSIIDAHDGWR